MIIETLQDIRRISLDIHNDPVDRVHRINRLANELLITLQAGPPQEAAEELTARVVKLLPLSVDGNVQKEISLLAEAFLEGASSHKLQQIGLVVQNHNLLVTQRLTRITSILGDQP
jgi:hypothetical protein